MAVLFYIAITNLWSSFSASSPEFGGVTIFDFLSFYIIRINMSSLFLLQTIIFSATRVHF
jgi:hypothetical protein